MTDQWALDADSHVAEPPDLWTSRVPQRYGDDVPHLVFDERNGLDRWLVGGRMLTAVANWATAISAGPANEAGQTVHFNIVGNTNSSLFSVAPAVSA